MRKTRIVAVPGRSLLFAAVMLLPALITADRTAAQQAPSGNTRQPIVTNQFTTTGGGALQQRRPGLYVQQGIAVQQGSSGFFDGDVPEQFGFFEETIRIILLDILEMLSEALSGLNLLTGGNPLAGLLGGTDLGGILDGLTGDDGTIDNGLTSGPGGSTPLP